MSSFTRVATGPRLPHPARSESPPLVLAVVGAILVYSAPRPPPRQVDRPVARLPRRLFALRTERAREQTIRSPFERPTAGGCRPSVADPAPLTRGFSQPRRQDPAVHRANGWSLSAPSPRAPAAKCPSFAGLPSPDSRVLSGKGHSASNRRSKRPSPLTTLPAASLHRILIAGCCKVQVSPLLWGEIFGRDLFSGYHRKCQHVNAFLVTIDFPLRQTFKLATTS